MTRLDLAMRSTCPRCGAEWTGWTWGTYRVNEHSLVATGPSLVIYLTRCEHTRPTDERLTPDEPSQGRIDAVRAKRGWT